MWGRLDQFGDDMTCGRFAGTYSIHLLQRPVRCNCHVTGTCLDVHPSRTDIMKKRIKPTYLFYFRSTDAINNNYKLHSTQIITGLNYYTVSALSFNRDCIQESLSMSQWFHDISIRHPYPSIFRTMILINTCFQVLLIIDILQQVNSCSHLCPFLQYHHHDLWHSVS